MPEQDKYKDQPKPPAPRPPEPPEVKRDAKPERIPAPSESTSNSKPHETDADVPPLAHREGDRLSVPDGIPRANPMNLPLEDTVSRSQPMRTKLEDPAKPDKDAKRDDVKK